MKLFDRLVGGPRRCQASAAAGWHLRVQGGGLRLRGRVAAEELVKRSELDVGAEVVRGNALELSRLESVAEVTVLADASLVWPNVRGHDLVGPTRRSIGRIKLGGDPPRAEMASAEKR